MHVLTKLIREPCYLDRREGSLTPKRPREGVRRQASCWPTGRWHG